MPNLPRRIIERIYDYLNVRFFGIEITSPPDDSKFEPGVPIELRAFRKRGLSPSGDITWSSSIDGTLGTGGVLTIPIPSVDGIPPRLGQHVIRAEHPSFLSGYSWTDEISLIVVPCLAYGREIEAANGIPRFISDDYIAPYGIPRFVLANYIELDKIHSISRFRSGSGHDCSDSFEQCRSMKHYFKPLEEHASRVKIFSPVTGILADIRPEKEGGDEVEIKWADCPRIRIAIHHVNLFKSLKKEYDECRSDEKELIVAAGEQLGVHIGKQTCSDIEVVVYFKNDEDGEPLNQKISYFTVMTDTVFQEYQAQDYLTPDVDTRDDFIISQEVRDRHPLDCPGEWGEGTYLD